MVTLLKKPSCVQCDMTVRLFKRNGIEWVERDMVEDPEALALAKELGYLQAPVVIVGGDHWSGFQPDRINALA